MRVPIPELLTPTFENRDVANFLTRNILTLRCKRMQRMQSISKTNSISVPKSDTHLTVFVLDVIRHFRLTA